MSAPDNESVEPKLPKGAGGLLRIAIDRPVTVVVGVLLVGMFGALSVVDIPIQLTPDVSRPTLTVSTSWPGSAPTEVESEILEAQEEVLKGLDGLVEMRSEARPDRGSVTLEFEVGTDIDQALVRASNRLGQISGYPDAANEPALQTADTAGPPLAVIAIRSPTGESPAAHRTWLQQAIIPEIERIPGVADVRHIGGRDTEIHVDFDAAELAARGITVATLIARLQSELRDVSGGDLTLGRRRVLVRTLAAPTDPEVLERVILGSSPNQTPIRLGDVANVTLGLRKASGVALSDDRPSMVLLLSRETGTNVLEVTEELRRRVTELNETRFAREGLEIEVLSDQTAYITGALSLVQQNLVLGGAFAVLVLLLFLRSFGASAIISISIPVCVLATALGMTLLGRTINVVSLAGITFAIGMVLDNSIVSLEAIDSFRSQSRSAAEAALRGIKKVWGAILASTATTAAVFVPVIAWQGEVGQLLRDVAVAISFAVIVSLLVSVLVIPSLAAKLLRPRNNTASKLAATGAWLRGAIVRQVRWLTATPVRSGTVVVLSIAGSIALAGLLLPPLEYLPKGNRNLIFGVLIPPPGTAIEELEDVGADVQATMTRHRGAVVDGV
ncbi:MAG: efflux RND transporter permease subunit, partial [Myxococcota bacterium]